MNLSANMCADNINHHNTSVFIDVLKLSAEKGGFEPPVQFPVRQFSKLLVSATHPPLQVQ